MSRIGKQPVPVPAGLKVAVNASARTVDITGPKGTVKVSYRPEVEVRWDEAAKRLTCAVDTARLDEGNRRAYWGLTRANLRNAVEGAEKGFSRTLEINGVGWGAKVQGKDLVLSVGFANQIVLRIPADVKVDLNASQIIVSGPDRQAVGAFAARIRSQRKPEPYNGKGIKYTDETIIRKQGKAFGS